MSIPKTLFKYEDRSIWSLKKISAWICEVPCKMNMTLRIEYFGYVYRIWMNCQKKSYIDSSHLQFFSSFMQIRRIKSECTFSLTSTTCLLCRPHEWPSEFLEVKWLPLTYRRIMNKPGSYLVSIFIWTNFFLTYPNNISTGFSQGLYWALNKILAFIFRQV
jgi:hypothetical protein